MGRIRCRVSRGGGSTKKRDTPVKPALSRRHKPRRLLPKKQLEALPEEPEVEISVPAVKPASPVLAQTIAKPVQCKSVLHLRSPAYMENPGQKAVLSATPTVKKPGCRVSPTWHQTNQMAPEPEAFKSGEMLVKEEEQNLAVTPESTTSSSMEIDTIFNFNDDEEDCYSSASSSSSSLPSPEIFRRENSVETATFPIKEELLGLHLKIKNSTLLDVSHAETIHMHHPPNLSTIIDASTILAEKNCEISNHRGPEPKTKTQTDSHNLDNQTQAIKLKTLAQVRKSPGYLLQLNYKRPILYKKVSFKTPIISETFEANHIPANKLTTHNARESVQKPSLAEQMEPDVETSKAGEINSEDDTQHLGLRLKKPVKSCLEKAKFFDFVSDSERDVFFQRMRERCVKLRSAPLFPLTAADHTEASVL